MVDFDVMGDDPESQLCYECDEDEEYGFAVDEELSRRLKALGIDENAEMSGDEEDDIMLGKAAFKSVKLDQLHQHPKGDEQEEGELTEGGQISKQEEDSCLNALDLPLACKRGRGSNGAPSEGAKRRKAGNKWTLKRVAMWVCKKLKEEKYFLVVQVVHHIGKKKTRQLVKEVMRTQQAGGLLIAEGTRKKSAGGVFFTLLKDRIEPSKYKEIMAREVQKKKAKKRKKRRIDDAGAEKRRRENTEYARQIAEQQEEEGEVEGAAKAVRRRHDVLQPCQANAVTEGEEGLVEQGDAMDDI
ncbi:unnamed protein product [Chrysoparadoxa australica]